MMDPIIINIVAGLITGVTLILIKNIFSVLKRMEGKLDKTDNKMEHLERSFMLHLTEDAKEHAKYLQKNEAIELIKDKVISILHEHDRK